MNRLVYMTLLATVVGCSQSGMMLEPKSPAKIQPRFYGTGSHGSGGGDNGLAWFPHGERTISYCVFNTPAGPSKQLVREAFEKGFEIVRDYYISKGVHSDLPAGKRLAIRIQESTDCAVADLILYPGTQDNDPSLSEFYGLALKTGRVSLSNPPSFAFRTDDPSESRTWATGYIWVAPHPPLNDQSTQTWRVAPLTGAIAHEIGHIFGLPHIPGTLMAASYAKRLLDLAYVNRITDRALFRTVLQMDDRAELHGCRLSWCPLQNYHGLLGETIDSERASFERITGRVPSGTISARFYLRKLPGFDEGSSLPANSLLWAGSVADELSEHRLFLEVDRRPLHLRTGFELFRNPWAHLPITFAGSSYQARLHTLGRERVPVQIQRNHVSADGNGSQFYLADWEGNLFFTAHNHETLLRTVSVPKPDLKIAKVNRESESTLSVDVTNVGQAKAWGNNLTARRDGKWVGTSWVTPLQPGETVTVRLSLAGNSETSDRGTVSVSELDFGSEQVALTWKDERIVLFRDQLYLPRDPNFSSENRFPLSIEVDAWNSVLESDEANNTQTWD